MKGAAGHQIFNLKGKVNMQQAHKSHRLTLAHLNYFFLGENAPVLLLSSPGQSLRDYHTITQLCVPVADLFV
jgi:hypothetical protein